MRPLRLELTGFTCFKDFTRIEFTDLELFAIIGHTGAGKSSILDAICFALFEQTPRLGNKPAKELVSQGAQGMSLALEFEASDGRVYRVARVHAANKESQVRFERRDHERWVTAIEGTKKKEVGEAIVRAVGLDFDGFTRAVLLPQGEFDRFLRGEAKQRRELLKSLIGLERIEQMQKRAGEIARDAKTRADTMLVQLETTLSGATVEALEDMHNQLEHTRGRLITLTQELSEARDALLKGREIARLSVELEAAKRELSTLEQKAGIVLEARQKAVLARRALTVMPLLDALGKIEARVVQSAQVVAQERTRFDTARQLEAQGFEALERARDAALETPKLEAETHRLHGLQPRFERLQTLGGTLNMANANAPSWSEASWEQLQRLEVEIPNLERIEKAARDVERRRQELKRASQQLEAARTALNHKQTQLEQAGQAKDQAQIRLDAARELASAKRPELEERMRELSALKPRLERLLTLGGSLIDADATAPVFDETRWQRLEEIRAEFRIHNKLRQDERELRSQLNDVFKAAELWGSQLEETKQQMQIVKDDGVRAADLEKRLRADLDRASRENITAELLRDLSIGDMCPICGAPLKALPDISQSLAPAIRAELEHCDQQVRQLREEYTVLRETQKNQAQSLEAAHFEHQKIQVRVEAAQLEREKLEQGWSDALPQGDEHDPKSAVQEARAAMLRGLAYELIQAGASDVQGHFDSLQREKQQLERDEREANTALTKASATLAKSEAELQAAQAQIVQAEQNVERAQREDVELERQAAELGRERAELEQKLSNTLGSSSNPAQALDQAKTELLAGFAHALVIEGASDDLNEQIQALQRQKTQLEQREREAREVLSDARSQLAVAQTALSGAQTAFKQIERELEQSAQDAERAAETAGFTNAKTARAHALPEVEIAILEQLEREHAQANRSALERQANALEALTGRSLSASLDTLEQNAQDLETQLGITQSELGKREANKAELERHVKQVKELRAEENKLRKQNSTYQNLANDMRGNEFQDYLLASVQKELLHRATQTMRTITRERYSLELLDGEFCVRDSWNGLEPRSVKTLSGGESFIASLALALSLSDYLAGNQALGALFLDEGFGTLDSDALEMVANTLETLNTTGRMVGVITHVPTLAERLPTRLIIEKAQDSSRAYWES